MPLPSWLVQILITSPVKPLKSTVGCSSTRIIILKSSEFLLSWAFFMLKVTTDVINTAKVDDVETTIRKIVPAGLDYAVDSIGYGPLITDLLHSLGTDGKLYLIGIAGKLDLTGMDIISESKQIIGLIEGDAIPQLFIPKLIKYFKKGKFPLIN